jgi:hypothetical protein
MTLLIRNPVICNNCRITERGRTPFTGLHTFHQDSAIQALHYYHAIRQGDSKLYSALLALASIPSLPYTHLWCFMQRLVMPQQLSLSCMILKVVLQGQPCTEKEPVSFMANHMTCRCLWQPLFLLCSMRFTGCNKHGLDCYSSSSAKNQHGESAAFKLAPTFIYPFLLPQPTHLQLRAVQELCL